MQMQDKAKGIQAKYTERVERLHQQLPLLFPQTFAIQTKSIQRKYELTELSNVIICVVGWLSMQAANSYKINRKQFY